MTPRCSLITRWGGSPNWSAEASAIRNDPSLVLSPTFRETLGLVEALYPGDQGLQRVRTRLALIDENGFDEAMNMLDHAYRTHDVLVAWTTTTTWDDSRSYLTEHWSILLDDEVVELLSGGSEDPVALQLSQLLGEHLGRDPGDRPPEPAEPRHPVPHVEQDHRLPLPADDPQRHPHRASAWSRTPPLRRRRLTAPLRTPA